MEPKFDLPGYQRAMLEFMTSVVRGLAAHDPLLREIPVHSTVHGGPRRNVPGAQPLDHPLVAHEQKTEVHFDTIRNTDVDAFAVTLLDLAQQYQHQVLSTMFQTLNDVTDAVGNTLDAKGEVLSFDHIIAMLERMDMNFDENGRPIWPTIVANQNMVQKFAALQPTPEHLRQLVEIVTRKKAEYHAQKRTRRLSR